MKTIQLLVILLVIAFIIVVFLVGSGMLFGKLNAQVDLRNEILVVVYHGFHPYLTVCNQGVMVFTQIAFNDAKIQPTGHQNINNKLIKNLL